MEPITGIGDGIPANQDKASPLVSKTIRYGYTVGDVFGSVQPQWTCFYLTKPAAPLPQAARH